MNSYCGLGMILVANVVTVVSWGLCSRNASSIQYTAHNFDVVNLCSGLSSCRGFGPAASALVTGGRATDPHADDQLIRRYRGTLFLPQLTVCSFHQQQKMRIMFVRLFIARILSVEQCRTMYVFSVNLWILNNQVFMNTSSSFCICLCLHFF